MRYHESGAASLFVLIVPQFLKKLSINVPDILSLMFQKKHLRILELLPFDQKVLYRLLRT